MSEGSSLAEFGNAPVIPDKPRGPVGVVKHWMENRKQEKQAVDENTRIIERLSGLGERLSNLLDSQEFKAGEKDYTSRQDGTSWVDHISSANLSELQYYISVDRDKSGNANGVWFNVRGKHPDLSQIGIPHAPIRADESNCIINFYLEHVDPKKGKVYAVDAKIDGDLLLGEDYEFINEASLSSREAQVELHKIEFGGYPTVFLTFSAWGEDTKNKQRLGPIGRIRQMHILALGRKLVIPKGSDVMESDSLDIDINEELPDTHIPLQMDRGEMDIVVSKKGDVLGVLATGIRKRLNPADRDRPIVGEREKVEYQIPLDQIKADKIMGKIERAVSNFELACKNKGLPTLPISTAKESK